MKHKLNKNYIDNPEDIKDDLDKIIEQGTRDYKVNIKDSEDSKGHLSDNDKEDGILFIVGGVCLFAVVALIFVILALFHPFH